MARNSASQLHAVRLGVAAALWLGVVGLTQGMLGHELGDALRRVEDGIEQHLQPPATVQDPPPRSTVPDPIEPWELVSV